MSIKTSAIILTIGVALMALLYILPLIVMPLYWFVVVVLVTTAGVTVAYGVVVLLVAFEKYMSIRADRTAKQFQARVISTEHGTWFVAHKHIDIAPLSNTPYLRINGHERELTSDERYYSALQAPHNRVDNAIALLPAGQTVINQPPQLLSVLNGLERVLVKGPSNAGKTTLFQNIAAQSPNCIVIDPHFAPGIWPQHATIIGAGRNHFEIDSFFQWLSSELGRRYKLRAQGNESYPLLTIIIDEWMSISSECRLAEKTIVEMITESRKAKMRLFVGSHSDQVEALGIKGQGKLREGLLIVRLYYDQFSQERSATFDYGKGERPCIAPASFSPIELTLPQFALPELVEPEMPLCPICSNPLSGKQEFCSNACKQKAYRNRVTDVT